MSIYYDFLDLPHDASDFEITQAYNSKFSNIYMLINNTEKQCNLFNKNLYDKYKNAYNSLINKESRIKYDMSSDPFFILELPRDGSSKDVKKAYRDVSLKYHPDKVRYSDEFTASRWNAVIGARDRLLESLKRKEYKKLYDEYKNSKNLYLILNVPFDATSEMITKKYQDLTFDLDECLKKLNNLKNELQQLKNYYNILHDPKKRQEYDEELKRLNLYDVSIYNKLKVYIKNVSYSDIRSLILIIILIIISYYIVKKINKYKELQKMHKTKIYKK